MGVGRKVRAEAVAVGIGHLGGGPGLGRRMDRLDNTTTTASGSGLVARLLFCHFWVCCVLFLCGVIKKEVYAFIELSVYVCVVCGREKRE